MERCAIFFIEEGVTRVSNNCEGDKAFKQKYTLNIFFY